jgi:NADH/NAD ratio-sensing transcriptional regulator Rex
MGEDVAEAAMDAAVTSGRLARYLAVCLRADTAWITSNQIADAAGVNASQLRRDLAVLGRTGRRGIGYDRAALARELVRVLAGEREALEDLVARARRDLALYEEAAAAVRRERRELE